VCRNRGLASWLIWATLALAFGGGAAAAEVKTADQIKAEIAKTYDVQVLRIRAVEYEGQPAYAVTVMNPGGNFNEAFQVSYLLVDATSGKLIPGFRHRKDGYDLPYNSAPGVTDEGNPLEMRRDSERR